MTMPSSQQNRTALLFTDDTQYVHFTDTSLCLLPQMGKSMIERAIEQCVLGGCKTIWIISSAHQQDFQRAFGSGERWGCQFNYLMTNRVDQHPLSCHITLDDEMDYLIGSTSAFAYQFDALHHQQANTMLCDAADRQWLGWANLSGQWLREHQIQPDLNMLEACFSIDETMQRVYGKRWLSLTSIQDFYQNIFLLWLTAKTEQQLGHHIKQHATSHISGAVYIGNNVTLAENTKIGPNVIIEDGCYIDSNTTLSNCYIAAHTYIGKNLDVVDKLAMATSIYDINLDCVTPIQDTWIIGATKTQPKSETPSTKSSHWWDHFFQPILKYFHLNNV